MSIQISGTSAPDIIDTYDLQSLYSNNDEGFDVQSFAGDDEITVDFIGRNGVDVIDAGEGDDWMYLSPTYLAPIPVKNYAVFFGDLGTDDVTILRADKVTIVDGFTINEFDQVSFTLQDNETGELTQVYVSPTTEVISFGIDDNYLTEDIFNGRIRSVDFDERYERTEGNNADWWVYDLDTYSEYHNLNAPAPTPTLTPTPTPTPATLPTLTAPQQTSNTGISNGTVIYNITDTTITNSESNNVHTGNIGTVNNTTTIDNSFTIQTTNINLSLAITGDSKKSEKVEGTDGDDLIADGRGKDKLIGGDGADQFYFSGEEPFKKKTVDKVIDFDASEGDAIVIADNVVDDLTEDPTLAIADTKKDLKQLSKEGYDLVYFEDKGHLYVDGNGDSKGFGKKSEGGIIADLPNDIILTESDVLIGV